MATRGWGRWLALLGLVVFIVLAVIVRLHPTGGSVPGADQSADDSDLPNDFIVAILNSRPERVRACLAQDASLARSRTQGRIPLSEAVNKVTLTSSRDSLEVVDLLLKAGADPNTCDRWGVPVLVRACQARLEDLPLRLLDAGADPSRRGQPSRYTGQVESPLLSAVGRRYYDLAGRLVKLGQSPDEPGTDWNGRPTEWTPMRAAVQGRDQRMIDILAPYSQAPPVFEDQGDWE